MSTVDAPTTAVPSPFLKEEHLEIRSMVREFALAEVAPLAAELDEEKRFPHETIPKLAELGLMGVPFPEEVGGAGLDYVAYSIVIEELARVCGTTAITVAAHTSLGHGADLPLRHRGAAPAVGAGLRVGRDARRLRAHRARGRERREGDARDRRRRRRRLGHQRQQALLHERHARGRDRLHGTHRREVGDTKSIHAFVVEKDFPGLVYGKLEDKLGLRGSDTREFFFEDCRLPKENRLGKPGQGFTQFMKTLEGGRISIGAMALGLAQGALDHALRYAQERKQFGKRLIDMQQVAFRLSDMAMEIQAARNLVLEAAWRKDHGLPFARYASYAKLFASEVAMRAATSAVQVYGGMGYSREAPVERIMRDAKLCEIGEGTSEIQRLVISRFLDREGAEP